MNNASIKYLNSLLWNCKRQQTRSTWSYVSISFNQVDVDRRKQVGPDRLCAEWILKNGGAVRLVESPTVLLSDYNRLPPEKTKIELKTVDASNSSIMKIGFDHFIGCNSVDTLILNNCQHLESDGLEGLLHLRSTLEILQVSSCYNISDTGMKPIAYLKMLRELKIFDMPAIKKLDDIVKELRDELRNCKIDVQK